MAESEADFERRRRPDESVAQWHERLQKDVQLGTSDPVTVHEEGSVWMGQLFGKTLHNLAPDEPTITFRAQDILSTMVIQHYLGLLELYSPQEMWIQESLHGLMNEFRLWQKMNPSKVKLPD